MDSPQSDAAPAAGRTVRWLLPLLVVAALVALFWPSCERERINLLPPREPLDAQGHKVALAGRMGAVNLVHFWGTWCPPCVTETPALRRLAAEMKNEPRFRLLLVAVEDQPAAVDKFLGAPLAGDMLFDPDWKVANAWGTKQLPETYLVVGGKVLEKFVGATEWDRPEIRARLRALLTSAPANSGS